MNFGFGSYFNLYKRPTDNLKTIRTLFETQGEPAAEQFFFSLSKEEQLAVVEEVLGAMIDSRLSSEELEKYAFSKQ